MDSKLPDSICYRDSAKSHKEECCPICFKKIEKTSALIKTEHTTGRWFDLNACIPYKQRWWEKFLFPIQTKTILFEHVWLKMESWVRTNKSYTEVIYFEPDAEVWIAEIQVISSKNGSVIYQKISDEEALFWFKETGHNPPKFLLNKLKLEKLD